MPDTTHQLGTIILTHIINNEPIAESMGIDPNTRKHLAQLSITDLQQVVSMNCITYHINQSTLDSCIHRLIDIKNNEALINKAVVLGASRRIIRAFTPMSYTQFKRKRKKLQLPPRRERPMTLTDDEYTKLGILHSQYTSQNNFSNTLEHLRCLVYLSERSGLDINRIYLYFYLDNQRIEQWHH